MSNRYKNTAFWSWNGKIEKDEAVWQLADFKDKGYGGAFIHARGGLEIEYMGEEWFSVFDECVAWAAENDFEIWLYDEFGWPSGFGGGKVNGLGKAYQLNRLVVSETPIEKEGYSYLNAYTVGGKRLYAYVYTDKNYVDILDEKVTKAFIESTHEAYYARYKQYFGSVIKGVFTDEPQIATSYPYSEKIASAFEEKYGRDFHGELWRLFSSGEAQREFFYRYYSVIAELLTENYTKPLAAWCEARGVSFTGHFAEEDGLIGQYRANGGVMRNYKEMQQPGIDFLGRRLTSPVLPKQLASVKEQFGKETAISETFGCSGWNLTFSEMAWIWGYQAAFGLNKACLHLSAYTIRGAKKRDYPAFFSYQEPWWEEFGAISAEMERMSAFVSEGKPIADILLISPLTSVYSEPYLSDESKRISAQFRLAVENLNSKQYPFHIGDERLMKEFGFVTEDGRLQVGNGVYGCVLVSEAVNLEEPTWKLLKEFTEKGGELAFLNAKPETCSGEAIPEEYGEALENPVIVNRAGILEKYFRAIGYGRKVKITDVSGGQVCDELVVHVSETEKEIFVFAQNTARSKRVDGRLSVKAFGQLYAEEKLDTVTGRFGVSTRVDIPPMGNIAIRLKKGEKPVRVEKKLLSESVLPLLSARLTTDNSVNLDKAYFEIDGVRRGLVDTALLQDEINRAINERGGEETLVKVGYTFTQVATIERLKVAVETQGAEGVFFNGTDIFGRFDGWYVDKSILTADITDLQKIGRNELLVFYRVRGQRSYAEASDGFETERNVFRYKSEAESVYLLGAFSVENENPVFDDGYLTTALDGVTIGEPKPVDFTKELTAQGLYFYRGGAEYRYSLTKKDGERVGLRLEEFCGVAAKIVLNGKEKTVINPYKAIDVTELLKDGENQIEVTVYGSNRNLLGPFHHRSGEPAFVGNSTFRGEKGFEDSILYDHFPQNTYDENYHFVKFGLGAAIAVKSKI